MTAIKKDWFSKMPEDIKLKAKEVKDAIKLFFAEEGAAPTMGDGDLADGTKIKFTIGANGGLDVGSEVIVVAAEGETPAPEGDLTLADGSVAKISITDGKSVVSAITPKAEEMSEDKNLADVKERVTKIVEKFSALEKVYEEKFKSQNIQIENLKLKLGKLAKITQDITEVQEAFGMIETGEAIELPKNAKEDKHTKLLNKLK